MQSHRWGVTAVFGVWAFAFCWFLWPAVMGAVFVLALASALAYVVVVGVD